MSDRLSKYTLMPISWSQAQDSSKDSAIINAEGISEGVNVVLDDKGVLSKINGRQKYNSTEVGSSTPVRGRVSFLAEDGVEYEIIACNSKLYWTNGNGTYTAVKFKTEDVDITINPSYFHRFVVYDRSIGGTQKKIAYCVTNNYPVATNTAGTNDKYTAISRAIRLEVDTSTIIGKSVYRDDNGTRTPGADDVEVGASASEVGWPTKAKYITRIFDRVIVANYQDDSGNTMKNGWIASEAQNSENWTNSLVSSNTGGGKYPDEFTGIQVLGTSVLMFTRKGILNLSATPSAITNWREYWLNTTLGAINQEAICLHTDGWVYFCSEVGICRTDGRIAERVDYDIEPDIQILTQLKNNTRNKILNSTADWDAGTPASGDNLLDTAGGEIKQKNITALNLTANDYGTTFSFDNGVGATIGNVPAQSFLTKEAITLTALWLGGRKTGSKTMVNTTLTIESDNSGSPSGSVLSTYTITDAMVTSTFGNFTITLPSPLSLSANTRYWIKIVEASAHGDSLSYFAWGYNNTRGYTDGTTKLYFGSSWGSQSYEHCFAFYSATTTITSATIDFGIVPTSLGAVTQIRTNNDTGTTAQIQVATSTDDGGTDAYTYVNQGAVLTNTGTRTISGVTLKRYMRVRVIYVYERKQPGIAQTTTGAQWVSGIQDLGLIPSSWGVFNAGETKLGETISYEINTSPNSNMTSSDGYVAILNDNVPTNTKRRYIQYRVTFNTITANIPSLQDMSLAYYTSTSQELPVFYSFKDRLYMSFMENGQVVNNITWIGQTKSVDEIKYKISNVSGKPYPMYTKCDFIGATIFGEYQTTLRQYSTTAGFTYNLESGNDNDGTSFTSYFVTKAFSSVDAQTIWRYLYLYSKSAATWNFYYRTRNASSVWSVWSTAKVIPLSVGISRKDKFTFPGTLLSDFIQFKIETTATDSTWAVQGISLYNAPKRTGR